MNVRINGQQYEVADGSTLDRALERVDIAVSGVAVAVDGAVVPRAEWSRTPLHDGSAVEVLTAVQGG